MFKKFRRAIFRGEKEEEVIRLIREHLNTIKHACEVFKVGLEKDDRSLLAEVCELEKLGDILRRDIVLKLYEGAFIPAVRTNLYKFAETIDEILDTIEDAVVVYLYLPKLDDEIRDYCINIASINLKMSEDLISAFEALKEGSDLKDKTIRIRKREKIVDRMKHDLYKILMHKEVKNFWEGKALSDFITNLVQISDIIEDAGDIIQILNVSMR
jgi:predicted phosphate transport protein (TIGR00153 family)